MSAMPGGTGAGLRPGYLVSSARDAPGLLVVLSLASACGVAADRCKRVVWFCIHYAAGGRYTRGKRADDR